MTRWTAFLRGINLGQRRMKMAELSACLVETGFSEVKTVLTSGNVRFVGEGDERAVRQRLERAIAARFGFDVGVVLRSQADLLAMRDAHPFGTLDTSADLTRHVLMLDAALPGGIAIAGRPRDTEILRIDPREIYIAAYRQPNGRYTEHIEDVLEPLHARLGRNWLETMRNWNTIEKMLQ